jgi:hypothetical protein
MPNIYKLQNEQNKKLSKTIYTRAGAKAAQKNYDDKKIKTKIVVYKQNVVILDNMADATGVVESFREATPSELQKIAKKKGTTKKDE